MCEIKLVESKMMFPVILDLLEEHRKVVITITGSSMYPFLRENIDRVELSNTSFDIIKRGDMVLAVRESGRYVLHRVIRKEESCFYMVGDSQNWIEGPFYPEQLIAAVTSIWRGKNMILCTNRWWKFLSLLWLRLMALRGIVFKSYRLLRRII